MSGSGVAVQEMIDEKFFFFFFILRAAGVECKIKYLQAGQRLECRLVSFFFLFFFLFRWGYH